jgi:alpha-mannosidase
MIKENISLLRHLAYKVRHGFPETTWTKVSGPGPDQLTLNGNGAFNGLNLQGPGHDELVLKCPLNIPAESNGVTIAGEPLEATVSSLHPVDISYDGRGVFSEKNLPVAPSPALFTLTPRLHAGENGTIELRIRIGKYFMANSVTLKLTTPSLRMWFEQLDIAWAQLAIADALAVSPAERDAAAAAARLVPQIIETRPGSSPAIFRRLAEALSPLHEKAKSISVELIGHSHIDMNWLWTWPDTYQVIRRDFRSVLNLMDEYPELTFSHSQPATYEVIRQDDPALFAKLHRQIELGRWEPTTLQWVEPDCNMPSGEAHARQMLEAVLYTRKILGAQPTILHAPDTFGHAGNLPQLAASAGAVGYYHHRANPGQANQIPAYWWEGQDGTRLLAFSTPSYNGEISAGDLTRAAIRAHAAGHRVALHFHGVGDHGGGPARHNLDTLRRLQKLPGLPTAYCGTMAAYVRKIIESGVPLPVHRGESTTIFEGCYTTHADTKRYNRTGENLLCTADTLAVLAGIDQRRELTAAWRKTLFNQFHDILDGSAIHETYDDNARDFAQVSEIALRAIDESLDILEHGIPDGHIAVTNPLAFERSDLVVLAGERGEGPVWFIGNHGHKTPGQYTSKGLIFVARVPAFATVSYRITRQPIEPFPSDLASVPSFAPTDPRHENPPLEKTEFPFLKIETPHFRAFVRPHSGIIASLFDRRVGRELVGFGMRRASDYIDSARSELCLNVLQILDERPHRMSSWQMHEIHTERSLLDGAATSEIERGPVCCTLEVKHSVRSSAITQHISFYRDLPRIDFETHVDWRETGGETTGVPGLKVSFTAHLEECQAWFETPFAAVRRPADGLEVPALRWADVGGPQYGIALLNDSKYGYDALGCRLRITLLRSGYDPDPKSDAGEYHIRCSLLPHTGDWRNAGVVQAGMSFNQPLLARKVSHSNSLKAAVIWRPQISTTGDVQVACLKMSEDGKGRIFRLYESAGRGGSVKMMGLHPSDQVYETNIIEDQLRLLEHKDCAAELTFSPWQIRTVLLETSSRTM